MTTKKKSAVTKPTAKVRDLKPRTNPKGGGVIIDQRSKGSVNPSGWGNHNETFVSNATD